MVDVFAEAINIEANGDCLMARRLSAGDASMAPSANLASRQTFRLQPAWHPLRTPSTAAFDGDSRACVARCAVDDPFDRVALSRH